MKPKIFLTLILICSISFIASAQDLSIQTGHSSTITDLKFTPDSRYLVSTGADNKIILWDMASFMQMKLLVGHQAQVNCVSMSSTENIFATSSDDKTVKIWNYPQGELLKTYTFTKPVKSVAFSPDGENIACATDSITIINVKTDQQTKLNYKARKTFDAVTYSPNGAFLAFGGKREYKVYIYEVTYQNEVNKIRAQVNSLSFSPDSRFLYTAGENGIIKRRATNESSEKKYTLWSNNSWESFNDITCSDQYFISANRDNLIYVYDQSTGKRIQILKAHTNEPKALTITQDGKYLASAGKDRTIIIWNLEKFSVTKIIRGGANSITSLAFSKEGDYMFLTYNDGSSRIWNLSSKGQMLTNSAPKQTFREKNFFYEYTSEKSFYTANPSKIFILNNTNKTNRKTQNIEQTKQKVFIWDIQNYGKTFKINNNKKKTYKQYFLSDTSHIVEVNYNATHFQEKSLIGQEKIIDRQTVYSADVSIYDFDKPLKKKKLKTKKLHLKDQFTIEGDVFYSQISPDGEFFMDFKNTDYGIICDLWDLEMSQKISTIILDKNHNSGGFSPASKYFYIASDSIIKIYDLNSQKLIDSVAGNIPFNFSENEELCAYTDSQKNLHLRNFKTKQPIFSISSGHQTEISDIKFNTNYKFIATTGYDGLIKFWDINTGQALLSLAAFDKSDFIYVTPDNYYYSTKGAMKYISFILNDNLYTFDQFDIKYNRPDTVLSRLSYTLPEEIEIYKKAYYKRINKMGFNNYIFEEDYNIPNINIDNHDEIPISTEQTTVSLKITASDSLYNIDRINIWVNSVPIFGTKGEIIKNLNTKQYSNTYEVKLSSGINKIDVSAINNQGAESLKKSFSIMCEEPSQQNLYIVSVGISKYKDTTLNLDYAEKDASDVIKLLSKKNKIFDNVETIKLVNEQATRDNILAVKETLMKTTVNDAVILFFAGHGVLDETYNYYLTTHDFDYFDFFKTIVSYDDFVGLLDGIPARRKVVFIDACHSGEIDTDTDNDDGGSVNINKSKSTHGSRSLWSQQFGDGPEFGSQNSFELMKMMFADLRRGSGTTIISSAGGKEYAYESKKIQNGVFTYVLINGLQSKKADLNKDGEIMLSELQDYVMQTVSELTQGRQNPTNRRENLDYDFIIWK